MTIAYSAQGEPPLDQPWYGIGFGPAVKRFFKKYATFSGRASRGEYWWSYLLQVVVGLVFYVILIIGAVTAASAAQQSGSSTPQFGPAYVIGSSLLSLWGLGTLVPSLAITWRRLHDTGRSGVYILFGLIPLVGGIILIVFLASQTTPSAQQYGPPYDQGYGGQGYGAPGSYGQPGGYEQQGGYGQPGPYGQPQQGQEQQGGSTQQYPPA